MSDRLGSYAPLKFKGPREAAEQAETTLRWLLSHWVSELEPAVAWRNGEIIGLTLANAPVGSSPSVFWPDASLLTSSYRSAT